MIRKIVFLMFSLGVLSQPIFAASGSPAAAATLSATGVTVSVEPATQPLVDPFVGVQQGNGTESADAPVSIHFGNASFTPGGWVDFTTLFRSTDVGSGLGTSFATIPYNNTTSGELSETRLTAQGSRITLRADESFGKVKVFGYGEADFNGALPSNAYVSTNSDSFRLRVAYSDISVGKWELLAGQSWSLLTPNRVGISPFLSEVYNTLHLDTNYQVGLTYARQTQIRLLYHFAPSVVLALAAENPDQFSGSAVTFPTLFSNTETDVNSSTSVGGGTTTPSLHPDIISKLAYDPKWGGHKFHFETAGLLAPVEIVTPISVTGTTTRKDIREGGGILGAVNLEIIKGLHLLATGYWSDGGGRYIGGLGPGFVVEQVGSKTGPFQAQLVHSGSAISSLEWQAGSKNLFALSYSGAYFDRVFSKDPDNSNKLVGYGFTGSANSNNRAIQEATFASQTTLWKRTGYGSVKFITQSSYITRAPWYVATTAGTPKDAHVFAGYANLRYVLP